MTDQGSAVSAQTLRYHAAPGSELSDAHAAQIGPVLQAAISDVPEERRESTIVDEARPTDSPLHPYFEWDDYLAGERYRRLQATALLRSVVVEVIDRSGQKRPRLLSQSLEIQTRHREASNGPRPPRLVDVSDVCERAASELLLWRERWGTIENPTVQSRFAGVIREIDALSAGRAVRRCLECRVVLPSDWPKVRCARCQVRPPFL